MPLRRSYVSSVKMHRRESRGTTRQTESMDTVPTETIAVCGVFLLSMPQWDLTRETAWQQEALPPCIHDDWDSCTQRNRTLLHSWDTEACLVFHRVSRHNSGLHTCHPCGTRAWHLYQRRAGTRTHRLFYTYCLTRNDTPHACGSF